MLIITNIEQVYYYPDYNYVSYFPQIQMPNPPKPSSTPILAIYFLEAPIILVLEEIIQHRVLVALLQTQCYNNSIIQVLQWKNYLPVTQPIWIKTVQTILCTAICKTTTVLVIIINTVYWFHPITKILTTTIQVLE